MSAQRCWQDRGQRNAPSEIAFLFKFWHCQQTILQVLLLDLPAQYAICKPMKTGDATLVLRVGSTFQLMKSPAVPPALLGFRLLSTTWPVIFFPVTFFHSATLRTALLNSMVPAPQMSTHRQALFMIGHHPKIPAKLGPVCLCEASSANRVVTRTIL